MASSPCYRRKKTNISAIANALQQRLDGVILDGDEMRSSISTDLGFAKADRESHNLRVARLAKVLSKSTRVIVSVIAPFEDTRKKIDKIAKPFWIYVERSLPIDKNKPYQAPLNYHVKVNSDMQKTDEQVKIILSALEKYEGTT